MVAEKLEISLSTNKKKKKKYMYIIPLNILSIRVSFFGKNIFRKRFSLIGSNAKAPAYPNCIQTRVQFGRKHVFPFLMIAIAVGSRNPNLIVYCLVRS